MLNKLAYALNLVYTDGVVEPLFNIMSTVRAHFRTGPETLKQPKDIPDSRY